MNKCKNCIEVRVGFSFVLCQTDQKLMASSVQHAITVGNKLSFASYIRIYLVKLQACVLLLFCGYITTFA